MITYHWSRKPGKFLNKFTGKVMFDNLSNHSLTFKGSQRDWDLTLIETIIDVQNQMRTHTFFKVFASKYVCDIMLGSVLSKKVEESSDAMGQINERFTFYRDDSMGDLISIVATNGNKGFVKVHS